LDLEPWVQENELIRLHEIDETPFQTANDSFSKTPQDQYDEIKTKEVEVANL